MCSSDLMNRRSAVRVLRRILGEDHGLGITMFIEGEEEAGSPTFRPFIEAHRDALAALGAEMALEALAIYAQPKKRGRAAAKPPLRELGEDPNSKLPIVVKDGRFGPYVTDGETNASLRKGDDVMSITDERASELLSDRRARGPVKKAAKKTAAKKTAAKKTAAKKPTTRKTAAKAAESDETAAKAAPKTTRRKAALAEPEEGATYAWLRGQAARLAVIAGAGA